MRPSGQRHTHPYRGGTALATLRPSQNHRSGHRRRLRLLGRQRLSVFLKPPRDPRHACVSLPARDRTRSAGLRDPQQLFGARSQRELQELRGYLSPEKLLLASGAPILVIPSGWKSESIGNKILVSWNASREARRAVADALPFLVAASSVTLLVVDSEERARRHGEEPGADIALYLARHGVRVEVKQVLSKGSPVADIILSQAANHGVDLIVIGAYSHARSIEMLFGGVTRTVLKQAPVPVLMSR